MRRCLARLILVLAVLSSPLYGTDVARLISPFDGDELIAGSEATLAGPARTSLAAPSTGSVEPRTVFDKAPLPRPASSAPPGPVPVRLLIHRFNE